MSQDKTPGFQIIPYPRSRLLIVDAARAGSRKHLIHGLIEIDVTEARRRLRDHRDQTGESLSFTAFFLHCLGRAIDEHKTVHACRDWRGRLVVFDDVDVNTIIEVELEGHRFPLVHTVRAVNRRSLRELHDEIRRAQTGADRTYDRSTLDLLGVYVRLPGFLRDLAYRVILKNPHWLKRIGGTVSVTAVGMFGEGGGWGIPIPIYTLTATLGGIAEKAMVVAGEIMPCEMLSVTLTFDHDLVDGAPAARFAGRLKALVEGGYGLDDAVAEAS
jgi:pyruvate/2-oxoglutarate dehydrogenase complex dihydrolipoamide acyltransferase (E2) component